MSARQWDQAPVPFADILAGVEYNPDTDEFTLSPVPVNAGFELQEDGTYQLTADPAGEIAGMRKVGDLYTATK